jgi:hypothetical protein
VESESRAKFVFVTIDPIAVRKKISAAKIELGIAEEALDQAIRELETRGRAEKEIIGGPLSAAFERLRSARQSLAELEDSLAQG